MIWFRKNYESYFAGAQMHSIEYVFVVFEHGEVGKDVSI